MTHLHMGEVKPYAFALKIMPDYVLEMVSQSLNSGILFTIQACDPICFVLIFMFINLFIVIFFIITNIFLAFIFIQ